MQVPLMNAVLRISSVCVDVPHDAGVLSSCLCSLQRDAIGLVCGKELAHCEWYKIARAVPCFVAGPCYSDLIPNLRRLLAQAQSELRSVPAERVGYRPIKVDTHSVGIRHRHILEVRLKRVVRC